MITLIRWYMMKAREIKIKLALYRMIEKGVDYIGANADELKKLFVHELAGTLHNAPDEKI